MLAGHLPLPQFQIPMPVAIEEMHICRNLFFLRDVRRGSALQLISMLTYVCLSSSHGKSCQILNTWHCPFGM